MRHSELQKLKSSNQDVVCSGNRLCQECKRYRKEYKRANHKAIRRQNKLIETEE